MLQVNTPRLTLIQYPFEFKHKIILFYIGLGFRGKSKKGNRKWNYNPILKDSIRELDPKYFTSKKEPVDPVYELQKSVDNFEWSSGTLCSTTTLKTDENANFRPPNNGKEDDKPTKDDGKLKLNTSCFDYNLKCGKEMVQNVPIDTRITDSTKMIKKIEYLMNEIRNLSVGNLFFPNNL